MFHEQVPNSNLCGDAVRWTLGGPVVGAVLLHGMVALLVGGPRIAAPATDLAVRSEVSHPAYLEVTTVPDEMTDAPDDVTASNQVMGSAPAVTVAAGDKPAPTSAAGGPVVALRSPTPSMIPRVAHITRSAGGSDSVASGASTLADERSRENVDSVSVRGDGVGSLGTDGSGSEAPRGTGYGAAGLRQGGVHKALSARLVPASLRCADLFPYSARSDQETLAVEVAVGPNGSARASRVVSGHAHEPVFDAAALACARRLHFVPAQNTHGREVEGRAVVRLRFERAS